MANGFAVNSVSDGVATMKYKSNFVSVGLDEIAASICSEISQEGNLNANSRLFVLGDAQVAKVFYKNEEGAQKNLHNLKLIDRSVGRNDFPELALPSSYILHEGQPIGYIMPYITGVCLSEALLDVTIPFASKIGWFNELAGLISRLPSFIHIGDLHTHNVMIGENGRISLIDIDGFTVDGGYELTCPMHYEESLARNIYTEKYFYQDAKTRIGRNSDIYCLFVLFFNFLMNGYNPYLFYPEWVDAFFHYLLSKEVDRDVVHMFAQITKEDDNYLIPSCFDCFSTDESHFSYEDFLFSSGLLEVETRADAFLRQFNI